jgi:hypothetical protein
VRRVCKRGANKPRVMSLDGASQTGCETGERAGQLDCTSRARTRWDGLSRTYKAEAGGSSPSAPTTNRLVSSGFPLRSAVDVDREFV